MNPIDAMLQFTAGLLFYLWTFSLVRSKIGQDSQLFFNRFGLSMFLRVGIFLLVCILNFTVLPVFNPISILLGYFLGMTIEIFSVHLSSIQKQAEQRA